MAEAQNPATQPSSPKEKPDHVVLQSDWETFRSGDLLRVDATLLTELTRAKVTFRPATEQDRGIARVAN